MIKILKLIKSDITRLSSNVVAIVIIMGLSVIPALYAWFNILSNWDPYGSDATSKMNIAICSLDDGLTINKLSVNVGESVVESLKSNDTMGWIFLEDKEEAIEGVKSGKYYAAIVIPKNFTTSFLSVLGGKAKNPTMEYYENSKKNAIATKITSKVKTTVQRQVNQAFLGTATEKLVNVSGLLSSEVVGGVPAYALRGINEMDTKLSGCIDLVDALTLLSDTACGLVDSMNEIIPNTSDMIEGSKETVTSIQINITSAAATVDTISSLVNINLEAVINDMDEIDFEGIDTTRISQDILEKIENNLTAVDQTVTALIELESMSLGSTKLDKKAQETIKKLSDFKSSSNFTKLKKDVEVLSSDSLEAKGKIDDLIKDINSDVALCKKEIKDIKSTFDYDICPNLKNGVSNIQSMLTGVQGVFTSVDNSLASLNLATNSYGQTLKSANKNLKECKETMVLAKTTLSEIKSGIEILTDNEKMQEFITMLSTNPERVAKFIASPVNIETKKIYEVENYGSAMAPFYTVLALWVGALILIALIHVGVKEEEGLNDLKPVQKYFGRYFIFFVIGQIQALITVLGNLFYIEIQCRHPFCFWLSAALASFVFTIFIYSLTVAFGNIGEAIAVIVLVIQVAGAGGTFPVQVLPYAYRLVYKYLPFKYSLDAMRECIGGFYQFDYLKNMLAMLVYVAISIFIGLVLSIPFRRVNEAIEQSKEKSEIML